MAEKQRKNLCTTREIQKWTLTSVGQKKQPRDENGIETYTLPTPTHPHTLLPRIKPERLIVYPISDKTVCKKNSGTAR